MKFRLILIMIIEEPLIHFYKTEGFNRDNILSWEIGEKYTAVVLKNGNIGVCSNLHTEVPLDVFENEELDLSIFSHRIAFNTYLNAKFNYSVEYGSSLDIFDHIDFVKKDKIVMVGYFKPLVQKFDSKGIDLHIFDKVGTDEILVPLEEMARYLEKASTLILTSTTIFNNSFLEIINHTKEECEVYLLGPSSILHPDMKRYKNIKQVYGAVFEPNDDRVLNMIKEGHGTRSFLPFGKKVYI